MILINFIIAERIKKTKINTAAKKDCNKTATAAKKNIHNITVEENNNNNNKAEIAIYANSKLTNLTEL